MVSKKKFKSFDDTIFDLHPDLKEFLKPNDNYPELDHIKKKSTNLPDGSLTTKVIVTKGEVVERVFKTPTGDMVSFFSRVSNSNFDQVA